MTRQIPEIWKSQKEITNNSASGTNSSTFLNEIYEKEHTFFAATE